MLEAIVGSTNAERVLLFLTARGKGNANEIASTFGIGTSMVQKQLSRMERDGLLVHHQVGRARVYEWNPRFLFREELLALLNRALDSYPQALQDKLRMDRRRPRRAGKTL